MRGLLGFVLAGELKQEVYNRMNTKKSENMTHKIKNTNIEVSTEIEAELRDALPGGDINPSDELFEVINEHDPTDEVWIDDNPYYSNYNTSDVPNVRLYAIDDLVVLVWADAAYTLWEVYTQDNAESEFKFAVQDHFDGLNGASHHWYIHGRGDLGNAVASNLEDEIEEINKEL